jgi:hypothetical protein
VEKPTKQDVAGRTDLAFAAALVPCPAPLVRSRLRQPPRDQVTVVGIVVRDGGDGAAPQASGAVAAREETQIDRAWGRPYCGGSTRRKSRLVFVPRLVGLPAAAFAWTTITRT